MYPAEQEEALNVLRSAPVAHVAVVDQGEPYVTPVSFVMLEGCVRFRTGHGRRLRAIRATPRVCVEAFWMDTDSGEWVSAVAWGDARELTDPASVDSTIAALLEKYAPLAGDPFMVSGLEPLPELPVVVEVPLAEVSGMSSRRQASRGEEA